MEGVIIEDRPTDYYAGAIVEPRLLSGDWEEYKPTDEWQRFKNKTKLGYDTYSCVTFSAINVVEMQLNYFIESGLISKEQLDFLKSGGYLDENNLVNFNEWFTAVMSGTTDNGNSVQRVWDSIRKDGLLPYKEGFQVNDFTTRTEWLTTKPNQIQIDKALKILDILSISYEWVTLKDSPEHLKIAPLHILTPTGKNWNTKPPKIIADPNMKSVNHATCLIGVTSNYYKDLDHYDSFIKYLAKDYYIPYVFKATIELKDTIKPLYLARDLTIGSKGEDVLKLQKFLNSQGFLLAESGAGSIGNETTYFGRLTKNALIRFQKANNISPAVGFCGKITRQLINSLI